MRDHPDHQVEIMGGMWGARMDLGQRELVTNLTKLLIDDVIIVGHFYYLIFYSHYRQLILGGTGGWVRLF